MGRPPSALCPRCPLWLENQFPVDSSQFPVAACGRRLPRFGRHDMLRK